MLKMEKNERKEIENAIFDDDGNLITADKTWMEKEYEFKTSIKARVIPRWVVKEEANQTPVYGQKWVGQL